MNERHVHLADGRARALCVVPLDQKAHAALNGHRPLGQIVQRLKRESVELVAQKVLDHVGQVLVLLAPRRHLRLRNAARYLAFDVLKRDVAHVACLFQRAVAVRVAGDERLHRAVPVVDRLALVHFFDFFRPLGVALIEARLPLAQLLADRACLCFFFHVFSPSHRGSPQRANISARSVSLALL